MSRHLRVNLALSVGTIVLVGCSSRSPVEPAAAPAAIESQEQVVAQAAGSATYEILFLKETRQGLQPVLEYTLNVREYLVLKSRVADSSGIPAEQGQVTYEYCTRQNAGAAGADCESGRGTWKRLLSMAVDRYGSLAGFGACSRPRTIGFRFRYNPQGGDIPSGVSAVRDVSWQ